MTKTDRWLTALEARHFSELTFQEVSRSLRALSATYVERRDRLREGAALSGAGKRAAFALFYGPLHYLLVREIVRAIPEATGDPERVAPHSASGSASATGASSLSTGDAVLSSSTGDAVPSRGGSVLSRGGSIVSRGGAGLSGPPALIDLGCGTGAAGAAWAEACHTPPQVVGIDIHPWTLAEAAQTYRAFDLRAKTVRGDAATVTLPKSPALILAAFTVNELPDHARDSLLPRLLERAAKGDRILIVEPLAKGAVPWWGTWQLKFLAAGGRADEWRFQTELPPLVAKLDRAAGLNHRELKGRSLFL